MMLLHVAALPFKENRVVFRYQIAWSLCIMRISHNDLDFPPGDVGFYESTCRSHLLHESH